MKIKGYAKWASVHSPNTTFEPVWSIDLVISEASADALKKLGLKPKKDKDGDLVYKFKRKVNRVDGDTNEQPKCVDKANQPFYKLIGNGSEVIVLFSTYEWSNKFGSGVGADLKGVQVLELVSFGDDEDFENLEEGDEEIIGEAPPKPVAKKGKSVDFDDDVPDFL